MPPRKRSGKRPKKRNKTPIPADRARRWYAIGWPWRIIIALSTVAGLSGYLFLLPELDVNPAPGYDNENDPITTPLTLTSKGYLPVTIDTVISWVISSNNEHGGGMRNIAFAYSGKGSLRYGESSDFVPSPVATIREPIIESEFLVIVRYHLLFWPWTLEKRIRFKVNRVPPNGPLKWLRPYLTNEDRSFYPDSILIHVDEPKLDIKP